MTEPTVLVAGIGNIWWSDDGFGVEVASRLATAPIPAGARVVDFGIRGVHLAYELLEGYDTLVLVDTVDLGEPPGTVAIVAPDPDGRLDVPVVDPHAMSPQAVLATLDRLGGHIAQGYVVGCQPACLDEGIGLSPPVSAAVDGAVALCHELLADLLQPAGKGTRK
jgi:hydrogenase maturation protease